MVTGIRALADSARTAPVVFISYPRVRSEPADVVEMTLRRHGITVIRDEHDFGTGHAIPSEIREGIHRATVFVVTWCREYACSPHCFDELELALDRHERGELLLWIIAVDDTRVVPPRARTLLYQRGQTRDELMGTLSRLLREIQ
jgi:hypothetical protein